MMNHHAERLIQPDCGSVRCIDMEHADVNAALGKVDEPGTRKRTSKTLTDISGINGDHVNFSERRIMGISSMNFRPAESMRSPFGRVE